MNRLIPKQDYFFYHYKENNQKHILKTDCVYNIFKYIKEHNHLNNIRIIKPVAVYRNNTLLYNSKELKDVIEIEILCNALSDIAIKKGY